MTKQRFTAGWNEQRVREALEHYARQAEDEAAYENSAHALMEAPVELVDDVCELIAKCAS